MFLPEELDIGLNASFAAREMDTTFIFSTHDPAIVGIADHIIRLQDGLVVEDLKTNGAGVPVVEEAGLSDGDAPPERSARDAGQGKP